jgi:hypothetical protein
MGHPTVSVRKASKRPILKKNRTNLDTFAWYTGRLLIGVFEDDTPGGPLEILEAHGQPIGAIQAKLGR